MAGRPLIAHAIKAVSDAGASEVLVATDAAIAEELASLLPDAGVPVHFAVVADDEPATLGRAVDNVLGDGPLLVHHGDALTSELLPANGSVAAFASRGRTIAFMLDGLAGGGLVPPPVVVDVDGWRYDGTVDGILEANRIALDKLKRGRVGTDLSEASVQGRVHVDPTAELSGAKLRGPVYVGPGARIVETYVGPYTTIGAGVTLEGVEIEHSIVLPAAEIRYPGRRLEASLVGEGAHVGRDYSLPSAIRLRVGPGADIQLS